jgi:DNA-binding response OmpR family regulator
MNTIRSIALRNDLSHSRSLPLSGSSERSDPAKTVLVVDDDPMVRDLETQFLRLEGYNVLEAAGATEALQLADESTPIHLLITDFSMPEVDGLELTRRFRTVHPKTPVLMVSGSLPLISYRTKNLDRFDCLEKPFAFSELLQKVRALLNTAVPRAFLDTAVHHPIRRPWCCD